MENEINIGISGEEFAKLIEASKNPKTREESLTTITAILRNLARSILHTKFPSYTKNHGEDLVQEALLGVLEELKKYDSSKGAPSTFVYRVMIHKMYAYCSSMKGSTPYYTFQNKKIEQTAEMLEKKLGHPPTIQQIAAEMGVKPCTIKDALTLKEAGKVLSTDDENSGVLAATIKGPESNYIESETVNTVRQALLENLSETQITIISLSYGLGGKEYSPTEIAEKLSMPVLNVKLLKSQAEATLRNVPELRSLFGMKKEKRDKEEITFIPLKRRSFFDDDDASFPSDCGGDEAI